MKGKATHRAKFSTDPEYYGAAAVTIAWGSSSNELNDKILHLFYIGEVIHRLGNA